jgi:hypothetical protein
VAKEGGRMKKMGAVISVSSSSSSFVLDQFVFSTTRTTDD